MFETGNFFVSDDTARQLAGLHNALRNQTPKLLTTMREKKNTTITTQLDSRTLNYWTQCGLLDKSSVDTQPKWHKFSFVDVVFIHIARKLRVFGLGLEQVCRAKQSLFELVKLTDTNDVVALDATFSKLEAAILFAFALKGHGNIFLVVQSDGTTACMTEVDIALNRDQGVIPDDYICVNVNAMLAKTDILDKLKTEIMQEIVEPLQQTGEKQVLESLRQTGTTEVLVKKNGKTGKIVHVDMTQEVADMSNMPDFGNISIQRRHGKTVRTTRTTSVTIE